MRRYRIHNGFPTVAAWRRYHRRWMRRWRRKERNRLHEQAMDKLRTCLRYGDVSKEIYLAEVWDLSKVKVLRGKAAGE